MKEKVDAIYDLRDAAEEHARATVSLENSPQSPVAKDEVLESRDRLEAATADAIESCHHCGEPHATSAHA